MTASCQNYTMPSVYLQWTSRADYEWTQFYSTQGKIMSNAAVLIVNAIAAQFIYTSKVLLIRKWQS